MLEGLSQMHVQKWQVIGAAGKLVFPGGFRFQTVLSF